MQKIGEFNTGSSYSSISDSRRNTENSFYHSTEWRNARAEFMKLKRQEHGAIILDVYLDNIENNSPETLIEFMESDLPLSEKGLSEGVIKLANVVDHIKPIMEGGHKTDFKNLQPLTHSEHSRKTNRENKLQKGKDY